MKKATKALALAALLGLTLAAAPAAKAAEAKEVPIDFTGYTMVDISHLVTPDMPADPSLQLPRQEFFALINNGDGDYNLEVLSYCVHTGTHMDAPFHVNSEHGTVETIDPEVLIGQACVIKLDIPSEDYVIPKEDIVAWEEEHGEIEEGDGILIHTGHDALWEDHDAYLNAYPTLSEEAAQYLVDKKASYVAVEAISPDISEPLCHRILLGNGVEIVENVCNLGEIEADRCWTVGTFANTQGDSGVWVRILAYYK